MAKIAADSGPSILLGNKLINPVMVMAKNPKIGTDCKISMAGIITNSACLLLAAQVPKMNVNIKEQPMAINIRITVRDA